MIQFRRLAALVLGVWLGAGVFADFAVIQNFQTVDRFLAAPGNLLAAAELGKIGHDRERVLLRRNAGEENNYIFESWERIEILLGTGLMVIFVFGGRPDKPMLFLTLAMLLMVAVQHFFLAPRVTDLGRRIADLPADDPLNKTFWMFHGIYSGVEILKLLTGAGDRGSAFPSAKARKGSRDAFGRIAWITAGCARTAGRSSPHPTRFVLIAARSRASGPWTFGSRVRYSAA